MSHVAEMIEQIEKLDPVEREQMVAKLTEKFLTAPKNGAAWLANIVRTPGVCGGVARIIRTRIPVWTLERMRQLGVSESEILRSLPSLRAVDLVQAWEYAESHRDEIDKQIRENEED